MMTLKHALMECCTPLRTLKNCNVSPSEPGRHLIQQLQAGRGVRAWLWEDYTLPVIALAFSFKGGSVQDSFGKEGEVALMTRLLEEGAGDLAAEVYRERLDAADAEMNFYAKGDTVYGYLKVLADRKDTAFDLLRLALMQPRFDQASVERIRTKFLTDIKADANDPHAAARTAWRKTLYGDHQYSRQPEGTETTIAAITRKDLQIVHQKLVARGKLEVAVAGAIDSETLTDDLERIFGDLPPEPELVPIADINPLLAQQVQISYPLPKTELRLAYRGIGITDPYYFAAQLMNHILGSSSTSRLWKEVREKRGLSYSVSSSLVNRHHSSKLLVRCAGTRPDRAAEALSTIRAEIRRVAEEGVTEEELEIAKKNLIGGYAIRRLGSAEAIVSTLLESQERGEDTKFFERQSQSIQAVTTHGVLSVAERLFDHDPTVMVVGQSIGGG
ncbi:peptidase M16 [Rhizobium grahamii]|uniref:Peptidase M16 n=2 Tax=Rhizobium grahamii TaxID=1120045 RepID=A0A370KDY8_9HYPH|nr:peptidase M16 [Rhizobium grahamii]